MEIILDVHVAVETLIPVEDSQKNETKTKNEKKKKGKGGNGHSPLSDVGSDEGVGVHGNARDCCLSL